MSNSVIFKRWIFAYVSLDRFIIACKFCILISLCAFLSDDRNKIIKIPILVWVEFLRLRNEFGLIKYVTFRLESFSLVI